MSGRIQPFALSLAIGLLLPAVFTGGLAITAALVVAIAAVVLWTVKVIERKDVDLLLPIIGLVIGLVVAIVIAPLMPMPEGALWILLFAVLM